MISHGYIEEKDGWLTVTPDAECLAISTIAITLFTTTFRICELVEAFLALCTFDAFRFVKQATLSLQMCPNPCRVCSSSLTTSDSLLLSHHVNLLAFEED